MRKAEEFCARLKSVYTRKLLLLYRSAREAGLYQPPLVPELVVNQLLLSLGDSFELKKRVELCNNKDSDTKEAAHLPLKLRADSLTHSLALKPQPAGGGDAITSRVLACWPIHLHG